MGDDHEVGSDDRDEHDEYLHQSDEEVAQHIQFGEGMLGRCSNVANGAVCPAERVAVHYSTHVAILRQALAHQLVAVAENRIAAFCPLLA